MQIYGNINSQETAALFSTNTEVVYLKSFPSLESGSLQQVTHPLHGIVHFPWHRHL